MDADGRAALLPALVQAQALASLGALAVLALGGLDTILFLAPLDWGLGMLLSPKLSLALALVFYLAGSAVLLLAASRLRGRDDGARAWTFAAAIAAVTQLPAGLGPAALCVLAARRSDHDEALAAAPVLAGRGLRRLVVLWLAATAVTTVVGAAGVVLLFSPMAILGLLLVLAAGLPQLGAHAWLRRRIRGDHNDLAPAMPPLPDWSQQS